MTLAGKNGKISDALAGEWVQVMQLEPFAGVLLHHPDGEIDLGIQRSTIVEHWISS